MGRNGNGLHGNGREWEYEKPFPVISSVYSSSRESISELQGVICHMGSHSVTCHPTQVNAPRLNPGQIGRYSIYIPHRDGNLS